MGNQRELHRELINRCKKGDIKAQYSLYRLHVHFLYNISMRFMGNKMDADEIVQDTFITVFSKIDKYKGEGAFGQWLKRIAINNCISVLRKRKVYFEDIEEANVANEIQEEIDENTDPGLVHEAIKSLPDRARLIVNLYALEGMKHKEISKKLGITESTSKTQYRRAKQLLMEKLKDEIYENQY